jgi:hypothetical protein
MPSPVAPSLGGCCCHRLDCVLVPLWGMDSPPVDSVAHSMPRQVAGVGRTSHRRGCGTPPLATNSGKRRARARAASKSWAPRPNCDHLENPLPRALTAACGPTATEAFPSLGHERFGWWSSLRLCGCRGLRLCSLRAASLPGVGAREGVARRSVSLRRSQEFTDQRAGSVRILAFA